MANRSIDWETIALELLAAVAAVVAAAAARVRAFPK